MGPMHPLQIWMQPLEFAKYQTQTADQPTTEPAIPHPLLNLRGRTELIFRYVFMYVYANVLCNVTERIVLLKCWFCGCDRGAFYGYAYKYNTQCTGVLISP
jgi:hypothetical protein